MSKMNSKQKRQRLHIRLRNKISGSTARPRLSVNFTGQHIYAQIINDEVGKTLVSVCSTEKTLKSSNIRPNITGAEKIGKLIAERAKAKKIESVVFDRGGFRYHGKVKALAEAARSGGINF